MRWRGADGVDSNDWKGVSDSSWVVYCTTAWYEESLTVARMFSKWFQKMTMLEGEGLVKLLALASTSVTNGLMFMARFKGSK